MYARQMDNQVLTFDFAEGLVNNNLLVVDRETSSVWSQLDNKAISGPLKGKPMSVVPALQTTWKYWRTEHPDTLVMIAKGNQGRPYLYRDFQPAGHRPKKRPTTHNTSTLGLGLGLGGKTIFFPFSELDRSKTPLVTEVGRRVITVHYRKKALTAWAEDEEGHLLPGVLAYKSGWMSFNPKSEVYHSEQKKP